MNEFTIKQRAVTPIERMVDAAAGFDRGSTTALTVSMRCRACGHRNSVPSFVETDPPGTASIEITCPRCNGGRMGPIRYLDAAGRQLGETIE